MPSHPKIYHITHLRNLPGIVEAGQLWSDAKRIERRLHCDLVGLSHIKRRRLEEIQVPCHPGTYVGDYVPFYFCPRSIMLYILHRGNHPELQYSQGQRPIVHLQADLKEAVAYAAQHHQCWAFSTGNAGARYVSFFNDLDDLNHLNWEAIEAEHWSQASVKEGKQAEFLLHGSFPWRLVKKIGVCDGPMAQQVGHAIRGANHQATVSVERDWYY